MVLIFGKVHSKALAVAEVIPQLYPQTYTLFLFKSPLINPVPDIAKVDPPVKEVVDPEEIVVLGKVKINSQGQA